MIDDAVLRRWLAHVVEGLVDAYLSVALPVAGIALLLVADRRRWWQPAILIAPGVTRR